jgi:3-dehydroquinate dehydratase/shikimate dehydrogenase
MTRRPLLIEVVARPTTAAAVNAYEGAHPRADLVEIRLDTIRDLRLDRVLAAKGRPKLLTVRSRGQGGALAGEDREALLRRVAASRAEWMDIEPQDLDGPATRRSGRPRRILSWHDINGTPLDLDGRLRTLLGARGADLVKIVTFAEVAGDNLRLRDLLRGAPRGRVIAFAMGPKGAPSRILAAKWGSAGLYAPRRGAPASAPGQVPIEDLEDVYRWREIGPATGILGVLGSPVAASLSPAMHNAAFAALGLDLVYLPFEASTLAEFLPVFSELRLRGLSVTHPFKEAILPHLDVIDPVARGCGAANTVVKVWNRLEGHNTDVEAALSPLRGWLPLAGARVAVIGAGGAARALIEGLVREGARVTIFVRSPGRARALVRATGVRHRPLARLKAFPCDLVVNATPVGMAAADGAVEPGRTPVPATWLRARRLYDLVYNPAETPLMHRARARGIEAHGGLEMFIAQGAEQFRLFTGRPAPVDVMRRAVVDALARPPAQTSGRAASVSVASGGLVPRTRVPRRHRRLRPEGVAAAGRGGRRGRR